jgi:hypothetical protein
MSPPASISSLLNCCISSTIPPVPPTYPSLQTLRSLPVDPAARTFLDSVDSRVNLIFKSPDPRRAVEQHLLFAFLAKSKDEATPPPPSLVEAVETFFALGRGGLQDVVELTKQNAKLLKKIEVLEKETGVLDAKVENLVEQVYQVDAVDETML